MKKPPPSPTLLFDWRKLQENPEAYRRLDEEFIEGRYPSYHDLKHREHQLPISLEDAWGFLTAQRRVARRIIPAFPSWKEQRAWYSPLHAIEAELWKFDRRLPAALATPTDSFSSISQPFYVRQCLVEEAVYSAVYEGAATTIREGKKLLQDGRSPATRAEHMIVNTYRALEWVTENAQQQMTEANLFHLHRLVTENTWELGREKESGRYRTAGEQIVVSDPRNPENILHIPPSADQLPQRMQSLFKFADDCGSNKLREKKSPGYTGPSFMHPILRSVILHWWLAYEHPFTDGNGRCARMLFYWAMLRQGYWATKFISLSAEVYSHAGGYVNSFLQTDADRLDLTYFIRTQLKFMDQAIGKLEQRIENIRRLEEQSEPIIEELGLTDRQAKLYQLLAANPNRTLDVLGWCDEASIEPQTARRDLNRLKDMGLLKTTRQGQRMAYRIASTKLRNGAK